MWRTVVPKCRAIFQFTPLREGRRQAAAARRRPRHISIHAPPRGATSTRELCTRCTQFQFTPLREGRRWRRRKARCCTSFQFTPLREGRLAARACCTRFTRFQFTPLREGRPAPCKGRLRGSYFNSRPSARGDSSGGVRLPPSPYFNSRPSARGDVSRSASPAALPFQFTPLREGRRERPKTATKKGISIHAPPRGATKSHKRQENDSPISIHAPPRGATISLPRALHGSRVARSCCAHHTVSSPFWRTCVLSIHSIPLLNALRACSQMLSGRKV